MLKYRQWVNHGVINSASVNPLTPKSDKHLISPYNISPESHIKVMRIKEMTTN